MSIEFNASYTLSSLYPFSLFQSLFQYVNRRIRRPQIKTIGKKIFPELLILKYIPPSLMPGFNRGRQGFSPLKNKTSGPRS